MADSDQPAKAPPAEPVPPGPVAAGAAPNPKVVESAWRDQARWSKAAGGLKQGLGRWRLIAAVGGVVGALLTTLAAALPSQTPFESWRGGLALVGALVLGVVAVILRTQLSQERIEAWVRARSASEALKEEIYRFLVAATPYGQDRSIAQFETRRLEQKEKVKDLIPEVAGAVTPDLTDRPLHTLTIDEYIELRVSGQVDGYYRPKATSNARIAKRLRTLEFMLLLVATAFGLLAAGTVGAAGLTGLGSWVGVLTTAGAAVTAYLAAGRYDLQAITYYGTADRLDVLLNGFQADLDRGDPARISKFVDDVENAISTENEAWLMGWSREEKSPVEQR